MRVVLVVLVALILAGSAQAQETLTAGWQTHRFESLNAVAKLPAHWIVDKSDSKVILVSPTDQWLEMGLPAGLNPWLILIKGAEGCGTPQPPIFISLSSLDGVYREAYACREGVEIMTGFWEKDPEREVRRKLIELILVNIHKIK